MAITEGMSCDVVGCKNQQTQIHNFTYTITNQAVVVNLCTLHYAYITVHGWFYGSGTHPHTWRIKRDRIVLQ